MALGGGGALGGDAQSGAAGSGGDGGVGRIRLSVGATCSLAPAAFAPGFVNSGAPCNVTTSPFDEGGGCTGVGSPGNVYVGTHPR